MSKSAGEDKPLYSTLSTTREGCRRQKVNPCSFDLWRLSFVGGVMSFVVVAKSPVGIALPRSPKLSKGPHTLMRTARSGRSSRPCHRCATYRASYAMALAAGISWKSYGWPSHCRSCGIGTEHAPGRGRRFRRRGPRAVFLPARPDKPTQARDHNFILVLDEAIDRMPLMAPAAKHVRERRERWTSRSQAKFRSRAKAKVETASPARFHGPQGKEASDR